MLTDPDFLPFQPPSKPLGLRGLPTLWRNYIETIPESAYEEAVTRVRTRYSDVLLVCNPGLIGEILVEKAEAFGRDPATRRSFKPVVGDNSIIVAEGADCRRRGGNRGGGRDADLPPEVFARPLIPSNLPSANSKRICAKRPSKPFQAS